MKQQLANMMCLDMFLFGLSDTAYQEVQTHIGTPTAHIMLLESWDVYMQGYHNTIENVQKNVEFQKVISLAQKFQWKNNLAQAFANNPYEALVITDSNLKIIWVNNGFTDMTGYSKSEVLNRTPQFLQGADTSSQTKKRIKDNLSQNKPCKDVLINYRKDQTQYYCEVHIIPLYNQHTTHFIAFERATHFVI